MLLICTKCDKAEIPIFSSVSCNCGKQILNHIQPILAPTEQSSPSITQHYDYRVIYWQSPDLKKRIKGFDPTRINPRIRYIPGQTAGSQDGKTQYDYIIYMPENLSKLKSFTIVIYGGARRLFSVEAGSFNYSRSFLSLSNVDNGVGIVLVHLSDIERFSHHFYELTTQENEDVQNDIEDFILQLPSLILSSLKEFSILYEPFQIPIFLYGASFGGYNVIRFATSDWMRSDTSRQFRRDIFDGYIALNPGYLNTVERNYVDQTFNVTPDTFLNLSKPILLIQGVFDVRVHPKNFTEALYHIFISQSPEFQNVQKLLHLITPEMGHWPGKIELAFTPYESFDASDEEDQSSNPFYSDNWHIQKIHKFQSGKNLDYISHIISDFITHRYRLDANNTLNRFHLDSIYKGIRMHDISDASPYIFSYGSNTNKYFLRAISRTYFSLVGLERVVFFNFLKHHLSRLLSDIDVITKHFLPRTGRTFNVHNMLNTETLTELNGLATTIIRENKVHLLSQYPLPFNLFVEKTLNNLPVEVFLGPLDASSLMTEIVSFQTRMSFARDNIRSLFFEPKEYYRRMPQSQPTNPPAAALQNNEVSIKTQLIEILNSQNDERTVSAFLIANKDKITPSILLDKIIKKFNTQKAFRLFNFIKFTNIDLMTQEMHNWPPLQSGQTFDSIKAIWKEWIEITYQQKPSTIRQILNEKYADRWFAWLGF